MYTYALLFGSGSLIFILILVAVGALLGWRKNFFSALLRLLLIVFSFLAAIPLAKTVGAWFRGSLDPAIDRILGTESANQLLAIESAEELIEILPAVLITPLCFIVIFLLLALLTWIIQAILLCFIPKIKKLPFRLLGAVAGGIGACVIAIGILLPLWGTAGMLHAVVQETRDTTANTAALPEDMQEVYNNVTRLDEDVFGSIVENSTASWLTQKGDNPLYRTLAAEQWQNAPFSLQKELPLILDTAIQIASTELNMESLTPETTERLRATVDRIKADPQCSQLVCDLINALVRAWSKGESFLGLNPPSLSSPANSIIDVLYGVLATTQPQTLTDDIVGLTFILDTIAKADIANIEDMSVESGTKLIDQLNTVIDTYPRYEPLRDMITTYQVALAARQMANDTALIEKVSSELTEIQKEIADLPREEQKKAVTDKVNTILDDHDMENYRDLANDVLDSMLDDVLNTLNSSASLSNEELLSQLEKIYGDLLPQ